MYRVLLPEGEITVTSSIEFLYEEINRDFNTAFLRAECLAPEDDKDHRALFIHLKLPYTKHDGVLIGNLSGTKVAEIKEKLLKDGYYDFSQKAMEYTQGLISASDAENDEIYYCHLEEQVFQELLKLACVSSSQ